VCLRLLVAQEHACFQVAAAPRVHRSLREALRYGAKGETGADRLMVEVQSGGAIPSLRRMVFGPSDEQTRPPGAAGTAKSEEALGSNAPSSPVSRQSLPAEFRT